MIVMDGAAIYSTKDNSYLWTQPMEESNLKALLGVLDELGYSYFIYTVHKNRTSIFHVGSYPAEERQLLDRMKSSPYRDYLEGELTDMSEVVYVKIVAEDSRIAEVSAALHKALPGRPYRMVVRSQDYVPGASAVYIYSSLAVPGHARSVLMDMLKKGGEDLVFDEPVLKDAYRSEADAMRLLGQIENKYEPIIFFGRN